MKMTSLNMNIKLKVIKLKKEKRTSLEKTPIIKIYRV